MTHDGIRWQWGDKEEIASRQLKRSLVMAPLLKMPDFELIFVVTTDVWYQWEPY